MAQFSHFDDQGRTRMVDIDSKPVSARNAVASGIVKMQPETLVQIQEMKFAKGNVFEVARIAGIMAAKQTSSIIPLCHPIALSSVEIEFDVVDTRTVRISCDVRLQGKTGAEMEALFAVSTAALTIYDMCKSVDRTMKVTDVQLEEKSGGKSGHFKREAETR